MKKVVLLIVASMFFSLQAQIKNDALATPITGAIQLNTPTFGNCEGNCFTEPNSVGINANNFQTSHGSTSYRRNNIWMWSYNNNGEGTFTNYNLKKGKQYCIEVDIKLARSPQNGNLKINPSAVFNIRAANTIATNVSGGGGRPIPSTSGTENIFSGNYTTDGYPLNQVITIKMNYTPNGDYSKIWFYPQSPTLPQIEFELLGLRIKEVIDCPCVIEGNIKIDRENKCDHVFHANVSTGSGTKTKGYLWNFGDGTTSTQQNSTHSYSNPGVYVVTLTVYGINEKGDCCTKVFKREVKVEDTCEVECKTKASFKVTSSGFWFWRTYNFTNTSTTNSNTTIVGYEWYIDGVLVSTSKDFRYNRRRGKKVCLKVYAIDKNGNCCQDEYCADLRQRIHYEDLIKEQF